MTIDKKILEFDNVGFSPGEISSDYYGLIDSPVRNSGYKNIMNFLSYPYTGYFVRAGSALIKSTDTPNKIEDWGTRGILFETDGIHIYTTSPLKNVVTLTYPTELGTPFDLTLLTEIIPITETLNSIMFYIKYNGKKFYLNFNIDSSQSYTVGATAITYTDTSGTTPFDPISLVSAQSRMMAISNNKVFFSQLGDFSKFSSDSVPADLTKSFAFSIGSEKIGTKLQDLIYVQNYLFLVSEDKYHVISFNSNATTVLEFFTLYSVNKTPSTQSKFLSYGRNIYCVGDGYIDSLDFESLTQTLSFRDISRFFSHFSADSPFKFISHKIINGRMSLFVGNGDHLYRIVFVEANKEIKLNCTEIKYAPMYEGHETSVITNLSSKGTLIELYYKEKYYLLSKLYTNDPTDSDKSYIQGNTNIDKLFLLSDPLTCDRLDISRAKSTVDVSDIFLLNDKTLKFPSSKYKDTDFSKGDNLLIQCVLGDKEVLFDVIVDSASSKGDFIQVVIQDTLANRDPDILVVDPLTGTYAVTRFVYYGKLIKYDIANEDLSYLDSFYNTNLVILKLFTKEGLSITYIKSAAEIGEYLKENPCIYYRVGLSYRSYLQLLPTFSPKINGHGVDLYSVISNAKSKDIFIYAPNGGSGDGNVASLMHKFKNYTDEQIEAQFKDEVSITEDLGSSTRCYRLELKCDQKSNDSYNEYYIFPRTGRYVTVHNYSFVYKTT